MLNLTTEQNFEVAKQMSIIENASLEQMKGLYKGLLIQHFLLKNATNAILKASLMGQVETLLLKND